MTRTRIQLAVEAIRGGDFVVVVDAADRENEADLVLGAEFATTAKLAFLLRHTSGIVCAPMTAGRADALGLPLMVGENSDPHRTAFTISVDACAGTGISAADRAATARALADPAASPSDFRRPGHMFPLRAHPDGILGRPGHTEASLELGQRAGIEPVMIISELMTEWGEPTGRRAAETFARRFRIPVVDTAELLALAEPPQPIRLPTDYGTFDTRLVREADGLEHLVLTLGTVDSGSPVLVRIHSECATGDLFGSRRCDCGEQLRQSLALIGAAGRGVIVYERGHEGRGIGLADKLRAYALQDRGADTIDANLQLGLPADAREFAPAARVLAGLGVTSAILLTNNPAKVAAVRGLGIDVEPCRLQTTPVPDNVHYLRTKHQRLGHDLDLPAAL